MAHGRAVQTYRKLFQPTQKGKISITLSSDWGEPLTDSPADKESALRFLEFSAGWFADPIFFGDYPASMRTHLGNRLPTFTAEEAAFVKGSADFFGLNHYTSRYIANPAPNTAIDVNDIDGHIIQSTKSINGSSIGPQSQSSWLYVGMS